MEKKDAQQALSEEILEDARKRAERTLGQARSDVEALLAGARAKAQGDSEKTLREAATRATRRGELIVRTVEQEVARRMLLAREEAVRKVMEEASARLERVTGPAYRAAVVALALDALRQMKADACVVRVADSAATLDPAALGRELSDRLRGNGCATEVRVEISPNSPRGVMIESADGRLRWDNTFAERLRRLRAQLRRAVAPLLLEEKQQP